MGRRPPGAVERRIGSKRLAQNFVAQVFARPGLDADAVADLVWVINAGAVSAAVRENQDSDDDY